MGIPEPMLQHRDQQPYVGIRSQVAMHEMGKVLPPLIDEVFAWLGKKNVQPAGPVFWRYLVVDMQKKLEIDVGVPVKAALRGEGRIIADVLPAGVYATALFVGHPDGLRQATGDLLSWADGKRIEWSMNGDRWSGPIEWYLSNPAEEPDMSAWRTEPAFLTTRQK